MAAHESCFSLLNETYLENVESEYGHTPNHSKVTGICIFKKQIHNHSAMRKYNINILENPDTSLNKGRNFNKTEKSAMLKKKKSQRAKKEKFTMNEKLLRQMLRYNPQSKVSYLCSIAKNLGFLGS